MSDEKQRFFAWFEQPIKQLQGYSSNAFGVIILCFPLLERYLRQTSGCREGNLNDKFYEDFRVIFPELGSLTEAKRFWHTYRNGLLHQGSFSAEDRKGTIMPYAAISGETPRISYDATTDTFYVNPDPFSEAVLDFIRDDLATLAAPAATNHEIPSVAHPFDPHGTGSTFISPPTGNYIPR